MLEAKERGVQHLLSRRGHQLLAATADVAVQLFLPDGRRSNQM
jgi:hypothetical protein